MSIVLDALQKAERERTRQQSEIVVGEAMATKPRMKSQWKVLITLLVVLNVLLLASFAWFSYSGGAGGGAQAGEMGRLRDELMSRPMTSHVWSANPANRFILIDGRLIREGEELSEDTRLTEITETGIRVSYEGRTYPFSIGELWPDLADVF